MSEPRIMKWTDIAPSNTPGIAVIPTSHVSVGKHSHDFYELVYIREGFCLHDVDDQMTLLMEGDLFMLRPGQSHRYIGNRVVSLYNCLFAPDRVPEALKDHPAFAIGGHSAFPQLHLALPQRKAIARQLDGMVQETEERPAYWETRLQGLFTCMLIDCARIVSQRAFDGDRRPDYMGYVMIALQYIERHYDQELTIKQIADEADVSGDYLTRQFKQALGITPVTYMRRYRFARAMELLTQRVPVTEVAAQVGYRSLAHFSREFKKELGTSPSKYTDQQQQ